MRPTKQQLDKIINLVNILQSPKIPEFMKMRAQTELQVIKDEVTASQYNVAKDRLSDVQYLDKVLADPKATKLDRETARETIKKIVNESKLVKSMRGRLIKEMRAGRSDNVRDITEYTHSKGNRLRYEVETK